jgi:membrane-associated phospholipid phosphatase
MNKTLKPYILRIVFVVAGLFLWFGTQSLIAEKQSFGTNQTEIAKALGEADMSFKLTGPIHSYLFENTASAKALLIISSLGVDLLGLFLLGSAIFGKTLCPFIALLVIFSLRQICQFTVALPIPENMIWFDPGFPSLFVTYGVSNDFFFSGHTAISVLGACELTRKKSRTWLLVAISLAFFEASAVILLRAHYFMDVFTALAVALLVNSWSTNLARPLDRYLEKYS